MSNQVETEFQKKKRQQEQRIVATEKALKEHRVQVKNTIVEKPEEKALELLKKYMGSDYPKDYNYKMKSSSLQRHIIKIVNQAFVKFTTTQTLYKAWNLYERPQNIERNGRRRQWMNNNVHNPPEETKTFDYKPFVVNIIKENSDKVLEETSYNIDFRHWFICVASGKSLYKEKTKEFLTKKETHTFLSTYFPDFTIYQMLIYSVAKCEGASEAICHKLARSKISDKNNAIFIPLWKNAIKFFANHFPNDVNEMNDIWDYLQNSGEFTFQLYGSNLTLDVLRKRMTDWHYSLNRKAKLGKSEWEGHAIANGEYNANNEFGKQTHWQITQICNTHELHEEGSTQHHCVSSYLSECQLGLTSIWSLKEQRNHVYKRALTIELRNDGRIVQVRGFANRAPKPHEKAVVLAWARDNYLTYYRS